MNRLLIILLTLAVSFYPTTGISQPKGHKIRVPEMKSIHVVPIGIISYRDYNRNHEEEQLSDLNSALDLNEYDSSIDSILSKSYENVSYYKLGKESGAVKASEVDSLLNKLMKEVKESDIVLIHILAHGKLDDEGKYHLVCSDETLSGVNIRDKLIKMANAKNALVVLFLNTCNSGALFDNEFRLTKGAIAFFASSAKNENSYQTENQETEFTKRILRELTMEGITKAPDLITLETIENVLTNKPLIKPSPVIDFFPKNSSFKGYNIKKYPLLKAIKVTPPKPKNNRFYGGVSIGTNHTPTPYAGLMIGFDIKNFRVEAGAKFAFTKSEDVHIYNNSGFLQNTYNYRGYSFYGRIGYNIMSFFKKESRFEIVPLIGLSGNVIKGSRHDEFDGEIGKDAASLMFSANCRFAIDLTNKRWFYFNVTIGWDCALDKNVNVLNANTYNENWCKSRPYIELGLIIKTKLF